jgi:hypothetical protein
MMDFETQRRLQAEMGSGERLLWAGRPAQGLRFRIADAVLVPFSLLWAGFAVYWEASVLRSAPLFFALWGIPFVLIGAYMVVGRFFADSWQRSRTWYGLTDQRVVILNSRGVRSLPLASLGGVALRERPDRSGTITFGFSDPRAVMLAGGGWPGAAIRMPPSLEMIEEARQVYNQIRDAQQPAE